MQINRQAYLRLILLLMLAAVSMPVFTADTQNQAPAATRPTPSSEESSQTSAPTADAVPGTQQATVETLPMSGAAASPIKEFKPTEKIEADSAVSFPIDI
jgi:hypothetical protein